MNKYMRPDLQDEYGIISLQDKILEIMVYIDSFCKKHGIDYCLMAGSALGAKRHNGFIPWDDDIDIYMTEKDYSLFRERFYKYGDIQNFYLQEWGNTDYKGNHMITMAKLRLNGTYICEKAYVGWKMHQGIFVDIFILHNCPNNILSQKKQYVWSEAVVLKGLEHRGYVAKGIKDKVMLALSKCLPKKWILEHGLKNAYKYQNLDTDCFHGFIDTRKFSRGVFPKDIMFPTKYVKFETVELRVPRDNDSYLRIQFGTDYMQLPPKEKRPINKHAFDWKDDDLVGTNDYSDEVKLI